jgi:hypothetical protein
MSTRICGGKRGRSSSPNSVSKRINTLHITPPPQQQQQRLAGNKRRSDLIETEEPHIIPDTQTKRARDALEELETTTDTLTEKFSRDRHGRKQGPYESWYSNGQRC